jgi:hypothetical protein
MPQNGAQAGIHTRCLRVSASTPSATVNETFLLEVPDDVSQALAKSVTMIVAARRLHIADKDSHRLSSGLSVRVCLHDQTVVDPAAGVLAAGTFELQPEWLCSAAMASVGISQNVPEDAELQSVLKLEKLLSREGGGGVDPVGGEIGIQVQLQRVAMWISDTPTARELSMSRSQRGYRSLRLAGLEQQWVPIVRDGMQQPVAKVGALSGSVLGLDVGTGIVLEESFEAGVRREMIRSTVQVMNNLDFAIEVCQPLLSCALHQREPLQMFKKRLRFR